MIKFKDWIKKIYEKRKISKEDYDFSMKSIKENNAVFPQRVCDLWHRKYILLQELKHLTILKLIKSYLLHRRVKKICES